MCVDGNCPHVYSSIAYLLPCNPLPIIHTVLPHAHNRNGPEPRPLFLIAPGIANAQAAYFAFAQMLDWCGQPIYVLEKEDISVARVVEMHLEEIVRIQPEGPYLLGGHSYGGFAAMELAMQMERRGMDVRLVIVCVSLVYPWLGCCYRPIAV